MFRLKKRKPQRSLTAVSHYTPRVLYRRVLCKVPFLAEKARDEI